MKTAEELVRKRGAMKTIKSGSRLDVAVGLYKLAPGVNGYAIRRGQTVYIPVIEAVTPGSGDVGRFLDSLPGKFKEARIPNVINPQLVAMLQRRGFWLTWEPTSLGRIDVWVKP